MNEREIADWEREIRHAQEVQKQRKDREIKRKLKLLDGAINHFNNEVKDNDNEINR